MSASIISPWWNYTENSKVQGQRTLSEISLYVTIRILSLSVTQLKGDRTSRQQWFGVWVLAMKYCTMPPLSGDVATTLLPWSLTRFKLPASGYTRPNLSPCQQFVKLMVPPAKFKRKLVIILSQKVHSTCAVRHSGAAHMFVVRTTPKRIRSFKWKTGGESRRKAYRRRATFIRNYTRRRNW